MKRAWLTSALEAIVSSIAGASLGLFAGLLLGGPVGAVAGALVAGINGALGGTRGIYDWRHAKGWLAFVSDSTWSLVMTTFGVALALVNIVLPVASHSGDLSRRQNRHIYDGGLALQPGLALTLGNVISNANPTGRGFNSEFLARHEELHIWQARTFGPLFPLVYLVWFTGGFVVGTLVWLFHRDQSWSSLVQTAAYFDNPFEYWAYRNDHNWPPTGANPLLTWP
jgi:hypothetical protein